MIAREGNSPTSSSQWRALRSRPRSENSCLVSLIQQLIRRLSMQWMIVLYGRSLKIETTWILENGLKRKLFWRNKVHVYLWFDWFNAWLLSPQVECDVNMPEMYSFVRDRLHFLPTQHSINKQTIKLTVRPATSAQRNFTLEIGARYIKPSELQQMEKQISQSFKQQAQAKQSFFDYLWTSKDSQQEQQQQQPSYNQ